MARSNPFTFLRDTTILFLGVLGASWIIDPIEAETTTTLVIVALVLALFNVVLKPILVLFALPFVIFTFGLGIFVINAILLYLAGQLIPGFAVPGFGAAFLGALVISVINLAVNMVFSPRPKVRVNLNMNAGNSGPRAKRKISNKDVIDV